VKTELIFAEFESRAHQVNLRHFQDYFPEADIRVISEGEPVGFPNHPRYGWRMNDYYKAQGLLESKADIAIAFDADMRIVGLDVRKVIDLAIAFGLCLPVNPRGMVGVDNQVGQDGGRELAGPVGVMHAVNCGIIALDTRNTKAKDCVKTFTSLMMSTPMRGPVAWAKAFYITGFSPCLLPAQWCVCAEDVGCGNEIILHTGHEKVREHYARIL